MRDNQRASALSRRTVIAALAVGAAVNVPAIAAVAAGDHPDAELLELGHRYDRLYVATEAALRHLEDRQAAYEDHAPAPRDVMRHRIRDHLHALELPMIDTCSSGISCDVWRNDLYSQAEVRCLENDLLMEMPPDRKERAEAIVQEWRRWKAECSDVRDGIGLNTAAEAWDVLDDEQQAVIEQIAAAPATTLAGLSVRARILQHLYNEFEQEDLGYNVNHHDLVRAMIRDLAALAGRTA